MKAYIVINTELRTKVKHYCENNLFKLENNSVLTKAMTNVRKHRDFVLVANNKNMSSSVEV